MNRGPMLDFIIPPAWYQTSWFASALRFRPHSSVLRALSPQSTAGGCIDAQSFR